MGYKMAKTTDELKELLKSKKDIDAYLVENKDDLQHKTFPEIMSDWLAKKQMSRSDLLKKTNIYVRYGYEILDGTKSPSRDKILQLCLALELDVKEADHVLYAAGCESLYARDVRDSIIMFALDNHLTLMQCNDELYAHNLETLD